MPNTVLDPEDAEINAIWSMTLGNLQGNEQKMKNKLTLIAWSAKSYGGVKPIS